MGFDAKVTRSRATNLKQVVDKATNDAMIKIGMNLAAQAKTLAPVDQGQLRNSIAVVEYNGNFHMLNNGPGEQATAPVTAVGLKETEVYVGSSVDHAIHQEYGTKRIPAQPFLRPAAELEVTGAKAAEVMKRYSRNRMMHELQMRQEEG